jgi:hypothetical protein
MMADVEEVQVVVAHNERATLRVGDATTRPGPLPGRTTS